MATLANLEHLPGFRTMIPQRMAASILSRSTTLGSIPLAGRTSLRAGGHG